MSYSVRAAAIFVLGGLLLPVQLATVESESERRREVRMPLAHCSVGRARRNAHGRFCVQWLVSLRVRFKQTSLALE